MESSKTIKFIVRIHKMIKSSKINYKKGDKVFVILGSYHSDQMYYIREFTYLGIGGTEDPLGLVHYVERDGSIISVNPSVLFLDEESAKGAMAKLDRQRLEIEVLKNAELESSIKNIQFNIGSLEQRMTNREIDQEGLDERISSIEYWASNRFVKPYVGSEEEED